MYRIVLKTGAAKSLDRLQPKLRQRIVARLRDIAGDPGRRRPQVKALKGRLAGRFRLRVGDWRVIFELDREQRLLRVLTVSPREDAYD